MDIPTITTVHDLSLSVHPEWHPEDRRSWWEQQFIPSLARCAHIVTVSDFVKSQVVQLLGISPERVTRVYQGIREDFMPLENAQVERVRQRLGLPSRYLLHVGAIQPRKNLLMLIEAYSALPGEVRERYPLVLAGPWGWKADAVAELLDRRGRMSGIHQVGYVDDRDLPALYNGAHALVYPSLHEGFGLPPLEMMAGGGAVVASSAGALVETIGGGNPLIDPADTDAWRRALLQVCTDTEWWRHLRSGAREWSTRYSWERCATETLTLYRSVCGKGRTC